MSQSPEVHPVEPSPPLPPAPKAPVRGGWLVPVVIGIGVLALLGFGIALYLHANGKVNKVALISAPKLVTTAAARASVFRVQRRYVGTIEPWVSARVGPQFVAAYVSTVLVRPGAVVKRGQVLATLDCRNASALNKSIAEQAKAIEASQVAVAREASRVSGLVPGGYASPNEAEMKTAESLKQRAQYMSLQAQSVGTQLQVSDCVLRAPFDGEVAERLLDPGAFAHPGDAIVTVVDRNILRVTADVPEEDSSDVAPGTPIQVLVLATGTTLKPKISRRAPAADASTRTVHFEADTTDPTHTIPSGTTVEISLEAGKSTAATQIPLSAASIKQDKARVFVVSNNVAHVSVVAVIGEKGGDLFVDTALPAGSEVVTQGRLALTDGDQVAAKEETPLQAGLGETPRSATPEGLPQVAP